MGSVTSVKFAAIVQHSMIDTAVHGALHKCVGRGKAFSVKELWNASGVHKRVIEAAMSPVDSENFRRLNPENFWSVAQVLGAQFLNHVLPALAHQCAFDLPDEALPHPGKLVADSAEDHAVIAIAAADGTLCAKDHPRLWAVGLDYIERGMQLVGLGKHRRAA